MFTYNITTKIRVVSVSRRLTIGGEWCSIDKNSSHAPLRTLNLVCTRYRFPTIPQYGQHPASQNWRGAKRHFWGGISGRYLDDSPVAETEYRTNNYKTK